MSIVTNNPKKIKQIYICGGTIKKILTYLVNDFIRVSTALCLKHILVSAVPISLVAP